MAKLFCLSLAALAISTASSRPYNIEQISDNDLVDAKGLLANIHVLKRTNIEQLSDNDLIDVKHLLANVHVLKRNDIEQVSDNDLVDPKGLLADVDVLRRTNIEQVSDNDLVDAKGLLAAVNVLDILKRDQVDKRNSPFVDINNSGSNGSGNERRDITQLSDSDLVDAKNAHVNVNVLKRSGKKHCFKGKDGRIIQYSDNDLIDLKNLGINVAALNAIRPRDITQLADDDLVDAKNLHVDVDLLNAFNKRATIDAAMDVLRRADYDVDLLSMSKRSTNEMYQYTDNTHTCFCAAKKACDSPSTPTAFPTAKPKATHAHKKHHDHHKTHSHVLVPSPSHPSDHHKHHDHPATSAPAPVRTPSTPATTAPSCPAGWKHASAGQVVEETDSDLVDLKNLNLNLDILNLGGAKTSKTVPAAEKPTCTGDYCCFKTEQIAKVVQKNDNDLIDLKNLGLDANVLGGGGKLLGGLL